MISVASIENLKTQIDIIEVISGYIDLKRVGSNYVACCPFHNEKTPSFVVSPTKSIYHCYGCGASGNGITFIMEYEKVGFIEAVEKLADMLNFTLEYDSKTPRQKDETLDKITTFYHNRLLNSKEYMDYLHKRGVSDEMIAQFNLGFCPSSPENLQYINANGLNIENLLSNGILGKSVDKHLYVRFNERIMFPIYSASGKIVGFGGRSLKEGVAKYINSPQTPLFNKSKLFYGYHLAKDQIFKQNTIIITEGYLDVIMLHQAGFKNVVATLGTALTKDHIPLLNKGNPNVILGYDGDKAGISAALKASKLLAPLSKKGGVVIFPNGADPADMVMANKTQELKGLFSNPTPFIEFCFKSIINQYNLANVLEKEDALKESSAFLHSLSPLMQEEYTPFLANLLKIPTYLIAPNSKPKHAKSSTQILPIKPKGDKLERVVLRYMIDDENLLDFALNYIDSSVFNEYNDAFKALCDGNKENKDLIGIMIEDLPLIEDEGKKSGFEKELRLLLLRYFKNELKSQTNLESIIKIKHKITKLNQGELQPI